MQHLQKLSMMQSSTGNGWVMASYEFHRIGYYQEMIIILYHNWTLNMQKKHQKIPPTSISGDKYWFGFIKKIIEY